MKKNLKIWVEILIAIASIFAIMTVILNNTSTTCQQDIEELLGDAKSEFMTGLMQENFIIYETVLMKDSPLSDDPKHVEKWKSDVKKHDEWRENYRKFANDSASTIQKNKSCVRRYNQWYFIFSMAIIFINLLIIFLLVKSKDDPTKKKK